MQEAAALDDALTAKLPPSAPNAVVGRAASKQDDLIAGSAGHRESEVTKQHGANVVSCAAVLSFRAQYLPE